MLRQLLLLFGLPSLLAGQAAQRPASPGLSRTLQAVRAEFSGERALAITAFVSQYWRVAGNTGFDASLARVAATLDSSGFVPEEQAGPGARLVYRIERRPMTKPTWDPVGGTLSIVGQAAPLLRYETNRHMLGMYSSSTPPSGVEGDLVSIGRGSAEDFEKTPVAGKIVLGDASLGRLWNAAVRQRGALGVLAYSMPSYTRPEINRTSIQFTGIPWDSANAGWGVALSFTAREALREALAAGPVRVRVEVATKIYPAEERTLVAEIRGSRLPDERFVFSAHVQEPGANDNASGVGTLAEVARSAAALVRAGKENPARTITFLWGEEISSTARFLRDDPARMKGVRWGLSLDMTGEDTRKTGGSFLIEKMPDPSAVWTRGEDHHTEWGGSPVAQDKLVPHYYNDFMLNRCLDQATENNWVVRTNPFEGGSDHTPFVDAGRPGLLLWHFTDQFYHTDGDRIENVSAAEERNVGICALSAALALAGGTTETALFVVGEVEQAAVDRLAKEAVLSQAAVVTGRPREAELEILRAWTEWYRGALESVGDIESGGASGETRARLGRARERIDRALEAARRKLAGG